MVLDIGNDFKHWMKNEVMHEAIKPVGTPVAQVESTGCLPWSTDPFFCSLLGENCVVFFFWRKNLLFFSGCKVLAFISLFTEVVSVSGLFFVFGVKSEQIACVCASEQLHGTEWHQTWELQGSNDKSEVLRTSQTKWVEEAAAPCFPSEQRKGRRLTHLTAGVPVQRLEFMEGTLGALPEQVLKTPQPEHVADSQAACWAENWHTLL